MKKILFLFICLFCLMLVGCDTEGNITDEKKEIDTIYYVWPDYDFDTDTDFNHYCVVDDASTFISVENGLYVIDDRAIIISYNNEVDALPSNLKRVNKSLYVVEVDGDRKEYCAYEIGDKCLVIYSAYYFQTIYK